MATKTHLILAEDWCDTILVDYKYAPDLTTSDGTVACVSGCFDEPQTADCGNTGPTHRNGDQRDSMRHHR